MCNLMNKDKEYVANTYARFPVEIVSGTGSIVKDSDGKEYIDLATGIAVNTFGLCDEEWIDAVNKQLNTFQHVSNLYYSSPCARLAELNASLNIDKGSKPDRREHVYKKPSVLEQLKAPCRSGAMKRHRETEVR